MRILDELLILVLVSLPATAMVSRGDMHPARWGAAYGNSWRTTNDIEDTWDRLIYLRPFPLLAILLAAATLLFRLFRDWLCFGVSA